MAKRYPPSRGKASGGCIGSGFHLEGKWRRGWDSNPRYSFTLYNGLANRRLQPLGHLSGSPCMPKNTGRIKANVFRHHADFGPSAADSALGAAPVANEPFLRHRSNQLSVPGVDAAPVEPARA